MDGNTIRALEALEALRDAVIDVVEDATKERALRLDEMLKAATQANDVAVYLRGQIALGL